MSKRQELLERRIDRIESFLTFLTSQMNAALPSAQLPYLTDSKLFETHSHSGTTESEFIWGNQSDTTSLSHKDYIYLSEKVFKQLPPTLVKETRSSTSSEYALNVGLLNSILNGLNYHFDKPIKQVVDTAISGFPCFDSVRVMNGEIKVLCNNEVISTQLTLGKLPLVYFKRAMLELDKSEFVPDFSCGLLSRECIVSSLNAIIEFIKHTLSRQLLDYCANDSTEELESSIFSHDDVKIQLVKGAGKVGVAVLYVDGILEFHLFEKMDGSTKIDLKVILSSKLMEIKDIQYYTQNGKIFDLLMSDQLSYEDTVRTTNALLNIEEFLPELKSQFPKKGEK